MTPPADEPTPNGPNDWTLMFFFASDNPLAPLLVSQLKAIKDAGYQEHTEALVYFDPMEKGFPTKIYNVNHRRKADAQARPHRNGRNAQTNIGDGSDSFVRKMEGDEVDSTKFSAAMKAAMANPSGTPAHEALANFIDYGITNHRATNYMLFLIGHGMMVGRDTFLPDEDPVSAITLDQLKKIMSQFVVAGKTSLQLLALHSCSMSSIEVAYELRSTANYMMAHQGPAFVNSWPYRQLLKKIFNAIEKKKRSAGDRARQEGQDEQAVEQAIKNAQVNVKALIEKLYYHCLHNATDFLYAGYSADLTLCSLQEDKLERIKDPLQKLVKKLKESLSAVRVIRHLIVTAHWESQSFWEENYTDLYDFCFCLSRGCKETAQALQGSVSSDNGLVTELLAVSKACDDLTSVLDVVKSKKRSERFEGLIIHSDNFGWRYQYARGFSIYFPWSEPLNDDPVPSVPKDLYRGEKPTKGRSETVIDKYQAYDFTTKFEKDASWWSFLESYFGATKRSSRRAEEGDDMLAEFRDDKFTKERIDELYERVKVTFTADATLGTRTPEMGTRTPEHGFSCECPSIKNYPTDREHRVKEFSITPGALRGFRQELELVEAEPADDDDADGEADD
ncbi:MAG TPA: clostripain-related cysteine peptidase [Pyrinomonadaceae bacterium]|nr:clostripain-related cysteine peptidase [Pyrinomonadaceae bacterium]